MAPIVQSSARSCSELEQATWFLLPTDFLESVTGQHQQPKNLLLTKGEVSEKTRALSALHCSDPSRMDRIVLSQWSLLDTRERPLSLVMVLDMNWIATRMPHQLARLARHWTSTSDTGAYILPARQNLFNALLILARNWNRQHDSWKP